jgi:hypothetical protein
MNDTSNQAAGGSGLPPVLTNVPATPEATAAALAAHAAAVGNPCANCKDGTPCMTTVDLVTGEKVVWTCQGGECLPP